MMDYPLLCSRFLRNQDWAPRLKDVCQSVADYAAGHHPPGHGSRRRADLQGLARHARGLQTLLGKIDRVLLAEMMGSLRGEAPAPDPDEAPAGVATEPPVGTPRLGTEYASFLPLRLAEVAQLMSTLAGVSAAAEALADTVVVRRRRPPLPDPVLFGVEALRALWLAAYHQPPSYSFKHNQFGDFALTVLGPGGLGLAEPAIRTAVRTVVTGTDGTLPEAGPPDAG